MVGVVGEVNEVGGVDETIATVAGEGAETLKDTS